MRKLIDKKNCIEIGYLKRTHGVKGCLQVNFYDDLIDNPEYLEFLFFEIDGLLVPFFVEEVSGADYNIIKFKLIDIKEKAAQYIGCKIFIDKDEIDADADNINSSVLIGLSLFNQYNTEIGKITDLNDFGGNIVLTVMHNQNEVMIPFHEELVFSFDLENSTIGMECPDGILNLD